MESDPSNAYDERRRLFRLHPCAAGLSDEAVDAITEASELIRCRRGDMICHAHEPVTSIYFIIHGRLRLYLLDVHGNVLVETSQSAGMQFGALAASLVDPTPINCTAEEPTVLLRLDYGTAIELTRQYPEFRTNYVQQTAASIKRVLFNDKRPVRTKIVAFMHQSDETRAVSHAALEALLRMGQSPRLFTDRPSEIAGVREHLILGANPNSTPEQIRRDLAESMKSGQSIFDVRAGIPLEQAAQGFQVCERVFWCVTPKNWRESVQRLKAVLEHAPAWRDQVTIVWLLEGDQIAPVADELRGLCRDDVKVCLSPTGPRSGGVASRGITRLIHLLRGVKVGVALGGGAARGMAHLGILKSLEESGVAIDMIAGTSAGAMTGTLYAAGLDPDYLADRFVEELRPSWFFRGLPRGDQWYLLYKYRMGHFNPMLRRYLGDTHLEQLYVPMHGIAVDLISGRSVVRSTGDATQSILESINLPMLSLPINREGQSLVDGGLIDNVPADVLSSNGCNFIIAVSVTAKIEHEFVTNRPDTPTERMRKASTIQTLLRSHLVLSHSMNAIGVQNADFVIEPDVTDFDLAAFQSTHEMAEIGAQAARDAAPEIQKLLSSMDGDLFRSPS